MRVEGERLNMIDKVRMTANLRQGACQMFLYTVRRLRKERTLAPRTETVSSFLMLEWGMTRNTNSYAKCEPVDKSNDSAQSG